MSVAILLELQIPKAPWVVSEFILGNLALVVRAPKVGKSYFLIKRLRGVTVSGANYSILRGR